MVRDDTPIGLSPGRARDSPSSFWLVLVSMSGTATVSFYLLYWSNNFAEFRPIVETHPRSQPSIGVANVKPFGVICVGQHVKVEEARFSLSSRASSITYPTLVLNRVNPPVHTEVSEPHCSACWAVLSDPRPTLNHAACPRIAKTLGTFDPEPFGDTLSGGMEVQARILAIRGNRDLASRAGVPDGEVDSLTAERCAPTRYGTSQGIVKPLRFGRWQTFPVVPVGSMLLL
jgi:hypothetical protein